MPILKNTIHGQSKVVTDGFGGCFQVKNHFAEHLTLKQEKNQFRTGDFLTNTIEGFWGILKRAIIVQYHRIDNYYLQGYTYEVCFKYKSRKNEDRGYDLAAISFGKVLKCTFNM
jgi:hypothetical protein